MKEKNKAIINGFLNKGKICSVKNCLLKALCKTYCAKHYFRWQKTKNPLITPSGKERGKRNLCILGDNRVVESHGLCHAHTKRKKRWGDPNISKKSLSYGSYRYNKEGYILVRAPDKWETARSDGYILEHRYVMEKNLERFLQKNEVIHHKNGARDDNRIENLELTIIGLHAKGHLPKICPNCGFNFEIDITSKKT